MQKQINISILRIISTFAVVVLHTYCTLTENRELFEMTDTQTRVTHIINAMLHWTVPVFLVITGYLLLAADKSITIKKCLTKYVKRITIALLLYGFAFGCLMTAAEEHTVSIYILLDAVKRVLTGSSFAHLWYLYTLIGLYLILPLLKIYTNHASKEIKLYTVAVLYVFDFIIPVINALFNIGIAFSIPFTYVLFYVLVGEFFRNEYDRDRFASVKKDVVGIGFAAAFMLCIMIICRDAFFIADYNSFLNALLAIFIFKLFLDKKQFGYNNKIWYLDRMCFTVYLIHPLFIQISYRVLHFTPFISQDHYVLLGILFSVAFFVLSLVFSTILCRIKVYRKYIM